MTLISDVPSVLFPIDFKSDDSLGLLDVLDNPLSSMMLAQDMFPDIRFVPHYEFGVASQNERTLRDTANGAEDSAVVWNVNNADRFTVGDVVKVASETAAVSDVNTSTGKITVVNRTGSHVALTGGEDIYILNRAEFENYDPGSARTKQRTTTTNFMQRFSEPIEQSDQLEASDFLHTENMLEEDRFLAWFEMQKQVENAFLVGEKDAGDGTVAGRSTDGLNTIISTNTQSIAAGAFDEDAWDLWNAEKGFAKGSGLKIGFADQIFWNRIYKFYRDRLQTMSRETVLGTKLILLETQSGQILVTRHRRMPDVGLADTLLLVDPARARAAIQRSSRRDLSPALIEVTNTSPHVNKEEWAGTLGMDYGDESFHARLTIT